ncbi:MAG: DUF502 domain-containing protein [Phycisphaerae bacterium]|nr:DUF502 domain-containing protein [Phycisphaerae bacterium]MDW8261630.1 DUF502 domain-containing protein [Phycisphaerales bacterium]
MDNTRPTFTSDFRRFFMRGLSALLPTLITLWLLVWAWNFLWTYIGQHLIWVVKQLQYHLGGPTAQWGQVARFWDAVPPWLTQLIGVTLAVVLVYIVGLLVGNLIGRTFWKIGESLVLKIPVIRAIYPAVKQVTDFFLSDNRAAQFAGSRVVAIQPHENGIWTIGLVTGAGPTTLNESSGQEMINVFCPNSPAAFSGYVLVAPRSAVVELPMTVEEAMRLFVSGGVIAPPGTSAVPEASAGRSGGPAPEDQSGQERLPEIGPGRVSGESPKGPQTDARRRAG